MSNLRIGNGFDVHRLVKGRELILGGEKIDNPLGLDGHSDADVLIHSIIDSLFGASCLDDIGYHFPDNDKTYKDISSIVLLKKANEILKENNIEIINIDSTIICETPKLKPFISKMKYNISGSLDNLDVNRISIKGKTTELLGFTGRGEGIAVYTVALVNIVKSPLSIFSNNRM
ncbi:2-C-methyl-D-erythritol 2,4-cyclodiphosphate synthase [Spirochaetota bacterium]